VDNEPVARLGDHDGEEKTVRLEKEPMGWERALTFCPPDRTLRDVMANPQPEWTAGAKFHRLSMSRYLWEKRRIAKSVIAKGRPKQPSPLIKPIRVFTEEQIREHERVDEIMWHWKHRQNSGNGWERPQCHLLFCLYCGRVVPPFVRVKRWKIQIKGGFPKTYACSECGALEVELGNTLKMIAQLTKVHRHEPAKPTADQPRHAGFPAGDSRSACGGRDHRQAMGGSSADRQYDLHGDQNAGDCNPTWNTRPTV
jgi:hypothetical protein